MPDQPPQRQGAAAKPITEVATGIRERRGESSVEANRTQGHAQRVEIDALAGLMAGDSKRIDELADRVGRLGGIVRGVDSKIDDMRSALARLADAMASVVRLEVHHERHRDEITALRDGAVRMETRIDLLKERLDESLPPLQELRAAALRGVLGVMAIVGLAVLYLVIRH